MMILESCVFGFAVVGVRGHEGERRKEGSGDVGFSAVADQLVLRWKHDDDGLQQMLRWKHDDDGLQQTIPYCGYLRSMAKKATEVI
jgi:hypothetical protein